jgi:hypothetical protein
MRGRRSIAKPDDVAMRKKDERPFVKFDLALHSEPHRYDLSRLAEVNTVKARAWSIWANFCSKNRNSCRITAKLRRVSASGGRNNAATKFIFLLLSTISTSSTLPSS